MRPEDILVEELLSRKGEGGFAPLTANGVRITHIPSGIQAESTEKVGQHRNRALAMQRLVLKLKQVSNSSL